VTGVVVVRDAGKDDVLAVAWIERAAFPDPWPTDLITHQLTYPLGFMLIAEDGEIPVGYASFQSVGDESELLRLAVLPDRRRQGIAKQLLEHGYERLRRAGVRTCFLEVREDNESAIALYRAEGFEYTGRRRAYYRDGTDAFVLLRRLPP
jgi:ribosomal-protein-alanine N-acetyltransferase